MKATGPGDGRRATPAKAVRIVLDPASPLQEALHQLVRGCLAQFHANERGATNPRNVEFLHQARVALRRMRSALRLADAADPAVPGLRRELKWLAGSLGAARDWDVLIEETLPPACVAYASAEGGTPARQREVARLVRTARSRRAHARREVREALLSPRRAALFASLALWLEAPPSAASTGTALPKFAAGSVRRLHKRLIRDGAGLDACTPEERHRLRIDAKRLRYATEFFGSLFAGRVARSYQRSLVGLQDALGALNDDATATRLLAGLPAGEGLWPFIAGWLAARDADRLSEAVAALEDLAQAPRIWKSTVRYKGPL